MKIYLQLLWLATALCLSSCNEETPKYLGQSMEIYVDETASIGISDIPNQDFKKQTLDVPYWGYTTAAIWIKLTKAPVGDWIEINNIAIDQIEVYRDGSHEPELYGDKLSFEQRPVLYRNFVIPVNDTQSFIFRFSSTSSLKIPMRVWESEDFISYVGTEYAVRFAFFGLLFAIAIISFISFLTTRVSYFGFHGLYVSFFGLLHLSLDGLAYQFLWGSLPEIKKEIGIILLAATNTSYLMLNYYAVAVTKFKKLAVKILLGV